ncbi:MAG: alpha-hydroxy acid oxidase [bacterium]|nr:alpha-hydroxy acid oxidase [bacterium]
MTTQETFDEPLNLMDFERLAPEKLTQMAWDYYAGAADDLVTLRDNRLAFNKIRLRPRMMVDVSQRDLSTSVLGQSMPMPLLFAPTAFHRMAHPDGEIATVRAAGSRGLTMILSSLSTTPLEDVAQAAAQAATAPLWFQLYVYKDRGLTESVVRRAEAAGYKALVLTVDAPYFGRREADIRNRFFLPDGLEVANLRGTGKEDIDRPKGGSGLNAYVASLLDASLTWKDVNWLCTLTDMPVIVKGILRGDDAVRALEHGAKGVIVSNHGGRQLDTSPATIDVLPEITEAVGGKLDVVLDGGVRRGTDILKAVALGAKAVAIGRPILWGLAYNGEAGVQRVVDLLREEFSLGMALAGCASVRDITPDLIFQPRL